ncbi:MAG: AhpC/TSA family protein [Actinomycetota bacterium]
MCEFLPDLDPVDVTVVHFDQTDRLAEYRRFHGIPDRVRLVADPDRRAYQAFSIGRGSWWRVWGPRTIAAYGRLIRRGRTYRRHRGDALQLGGDVVIAANGTLSWRFVPDGPDDRPTLTQLENALDRARAGR